MKDIYDKLTELKGRASEKDLEVLKGWEDTLEEIGKNEAYLNLEETKRIVSVLNEMVKDITDYVKGFDEIVSDKLHSVNSLLAQRKAIKQVLLVFGDKASFEAQRKGIEEHIDEVISDLDVEYKY